MMPSIAVVVPAFNEAESIKRVFGEATEVLKAMECDFEIIVVDDGSTDGTGAFLDHLAEECSWLHVIHHPSNQGIGAALVSGYRAAKKDLIFYNSADEQGPMSNLLRMLPCIDRYDMVVGALVRRQDSILRILLSRAFHGLVLLLFGIRLRNINSIKLFRRQIFDTDHPWGTNLCLDTELVALAMARGYRVGEVEILQVPRMTGHSKVEILKSIGPTIVNLLSLRFKKLR